MEFTSFWLLSIDEASLSISLVDISSSSPKVLSQGPSLPWQITDPESFLNAFDQSLSQAAESASLDPDKEPSQVSLILPPFWVAHDGRILKDKLTLISSACKQLKLKPMGFIASDDAIVESCQASNELPSSFILLGLSQKQFSLSLVYFGKIKSKLQKKFEAPFQPQHLEQALLDLNSPSALPPEIRLYGNLEANTINDLNNYPWLSKQSIETFLHLPQIQAINQSELTLIFARVIFSQLDPNALSSATQNEEVQVLEDSDPDLSDQLPEDLGSTKYAPELETLDDESPKVEESDEQATDLSENEEEAPSSLQEVSPETLGFALPSSDLPQPLSTVDPDNLSDQEQPDLFSEEATMEAMTFEAPPLSSPKKPSFKLPKLALPAFLKNTKLPLKLPLFLLALSPLLILIPFLFSKADITLFINPYQFSVESPVTLDSTTTQISLDKKTIPVTKKAFTVSSSISVPTTGKKTVGEKSKGEITVYNKTNKDISLPKGAILQTSSGLKFELTNPVSVIASSSDLDQGVINLGKTKALVTAQDIGPEYNLEKDVELSFVDYTSDQLISKVQEALSGGSKREINAVAQADKDKIEDTLTSSLKESVDEKIKSNIDQLSGLIVDSITSTQSRIDYSREIGEEADELSASIDAQVTAFLLDQSLKTQIIESFLSDQPDYQQAQINNDDFDLLFKVSELEGDTALSQMTIKGNALPKIDQDQIKKDLSGKSTKKALQYLKDSVPRAYNFDIQRNFSFLSALNPLPFRDNNINLVIKTESL